MKSNRSSIPIVILVTVLLSLTVFVDYRVYLWAALASYTQKADSIQQAANKDIAYYNRLAEGFIGDPATAQKIAPEFDRAAKKMTACQKAVEGLSAPRQAQDHQNAMAKLYRSSHQAYADLNKVAIYIVARMNLLDEFAKATTAFSEQVNSAQTDADIIAAATELKMTSDETLKKLQQLKKPALLVYSNEALEKNLADCSTALEMINAGSAANDANMIKQGSASLAQVFQRDWSATLFQGDSDGLESFRSRQEKLTRLSSKVDQLRANF